MRQCLSVIFHIHISIYAVRIHLQLPQWWLPVIGLSLDGWWNSLHFDWLLPILLVQTDILHLLELLLTPLRRWRVYIESLQQMPCEACRSATCSLKIWVIPRFKQHASVKKRSNSSKCDYHVVKHSELSKDPWQTVNETNGCHIGPGLSKSCFPKARDQGCCFIHFFHWHFPHWKTYWKRFSHMYISHLSKKPPPSRVTRHSQSVRSSSKPCDLCSTAKLCREITVVALSTATAANGRRDTGEVEHSGL